MKKILLCGALLLSFLSNAQYFVYGFNVVPEDEVEHYIQNEHELFSKAATKAFKKGIINGWAIMRRVNGAKSEPNFYWYIGLDDLSKLENVPSGMGKAIDDVKKESGVPSLIDRALKNHNSYTRFVASYYRPEVITNKNSDGFKYFMHNYALVPDRNSWLNTQIEQYGPFIKKNMNNGKIKQEIWAPATRINPLGNGYKWNVLSVDGYDSLDAVFNNGGLKYPDYSSVDFDAIQKTMPNGWYKQVLWERVMWLDENGNLKMY
ncbi:MAG: hypothetical protein VXY15_02485 [Bacteroidota bacterium]|nr:hypothetical protein [Bacteroidota bacterium]